MQDKYSKHINMCIIAIQTIHKCMGNNNSTTPQSYSQKKHTNATMLGEAQDTKNTYKSRNTNSKYFKNISTCIQWQYKQYTINRGTNIQPPDKVIQRNNTKNVMGMHICDAKRHASQRIYTQNTIKTYRHVCSSYTNNIQSVVQGLESNNAKVCKK